MKRRTHARARPATRQLPSRTDTVAPIEFPLECSVCGVTCDSIKELADPDHHIAEDDA